jgi:septal ring factor EnvC (AmiA/AmiB activator)
MKQNPSRGQASASYLDTLRSEFDELTQQLQEAETAANTAQQEADAKRRAYHELEQRSNSTH